MRGIEIRNAKPEDAPTMAPLFLDRYQNIHPGVDPAYIAARMEWWKANYVDYTEKKINDAILFPQRTAVLVATDTTRNVIAGFAWAEAPQGQTTAQWRGITMGKPYEGHGVASMLEHKRQSWATEIGRRATVEVVTGNNRALRFFERHGFEYVSLLAAQPNLPFERYYLQLQHPFNSSVAL